MIKSEAERLESFVKYHAPIAEHLLREWTERLRAGERSKLAAGWARYILNDFCVRAWRNQPQSQHTLSWLAEALDKMLDHQYKNDARELFSLPSRRQGAPTNVDAASDIAIWVKLTIDRGYPEADSLKRAAAIFHRDVKHIRRQRKRALDLGAWMNTKLDWDEYFRLKRRPLPSPVSESKRKQARTRTR